MATTTLNRIMKKAASSSSVILQANRTPHRNYTSTIFSTPLKTSTCTGNSSTNLSRQLFRATLIPTHLHFSAQANNISKSDDALLRMVESDMETVLKPPRDFPFKIVHCPWINYFIKLTREFQGEEIKVLVCGPNYYDNSKQFVELVISISKTCGPTLEFSVIVSAEANEFRIQYLHVKNKRAFFFRFKDANPDRWVSDENLNKHWYTYLKDRGIEPSISKFLNDYMANKKYTRWFENLKKFIKT